MNKLTEETIKYIITRVIDYAIEINNEPEDDFNLGKKLAYFEVLDTIKNELIVNEQDLSEFGLDCDISREMLGLTIDDFTIISRDVAIK